MHYTCTCTCIKGNLIRCFSICPLLKAFSIKGFTVWNWNRCQRGRQNLLEVSYLLTSISVVDRMALTMLHFILALLQWRIQGWTWPTLGSATSESVFLWTTHICLVLIETYCKNRWKPFEKEKIADFQQVLHQTSHAKLGTPSDHTHKFSPQASRVGFDPPNVVFLDPPLLCSMEFKILVQLWYGTLLLFLSPTVPNISMVRNTVHGLWISALDKIIFTQGNNWHIRYVSFFCCLGTQFNWRSEYLNCN